MRKSHKILSLLLALTLLMGMMPTMVFAYDEEYCPHTNAVYSDEFGSAEATCFEPGVGGYWLCEDCWCYLDENKENEYWEPLPAAKKTAIGHFFNTDTGVCDDCGIPNPVYTKVTSFDDINEEDMYIIVAEIEGEESTKYFVLGGLDERHPDEQGNVWCPTGVTNAISVTANADGSISLVNQEVLEDGSPSEFMLDVNPEQFGDMSELGLTTLMLKLPNHCVYPFQSYSYEDNGYMGVSRYNSEYGMWDSSEWVIDFYTTMVTDDTYRYEDEFGSKTHAEQVADGNIDNNIAEGDLLLYKASFYSVGGAMFTLRLREYNGQYYFICGEDWCLEGSDGWDYVTDTTPTNDVQYAVSLYRYDVPTVNTHTCEFTNWTDNNDSTHTGTCECGESETSSHSWNNGEETKAPKCTEQGIKTFTCTKCTATKTETIDAIGHDWSTWTDEGATAADTHTHTCQREGCTATEQSTHSWSAWQSADNTNHKKTCSICLGTRTDTHKWNDGEITTEATEDKTGIKTYTCTACGHTKTESIDKLPHVHSWSEWGQNDKNTHISTCRCNETKTEEHNFDDGVVINWATHIAPGEIWFTCADCGYVRIAEQPMLEEHEWGDWTDNGDDTHSRNCLCNEIETNSHNFDEGKVTKESTHLEEGIKTLTCTDCGATKAISIDKTAQHEFGDWFTDETTDNSHYRECACGEKETAACKYSEGKVVMGPSDFGEGDVIIYCCNDCIRQMIVEHESTDKVENTEEKVSITIPEGSTAIIDTTTELVVEKTEEAITGTAKENIAQEFDESAETVATYDISMLVNGAEIQPGGEVEVNLPLPENINTDDYADIMVVYIDDEGNVTPCETTVNDDGTVTFITDHFSYYSIIAVPKTTEQIPSDNTSSDKNNTQNKPEQESPQTGDNILFGLAAFMFVSGFCTFLISRKKLYKE